MQKVFSINLASSVYQINEDAYQILNNYLNALKSRFSSLESGIVIINDIEQRLSEMIKSRLENNNSIVDTQIVNKIMNLMGDPSDFESIKSNSPENNSNTIDPTKKRLYRDIENRILAGVCAGFAAYFCVERWIFRSIMLFLVLSSTFNIFFLNDVINTLINGSSSIMLMTYFILWIAIPSAKTIAQKWEMNGQNFNISNFEKSLKKSNYDSTNSTKKPLSRQTDVNRPTLSFRSNFFSKILDFFSEILRLIIRFFSKITGFLLLLISFFLVIAFLIFTGAINPYWYIIFDNYQDFWYNKIAFCIFSGLIISFFIFIALFLLSRKIKVNLIVFISLITIWITSAIYLLHTSIIIAEDFKIFTTSTQKITFNQTGEVIDIMSSGTSLHLNNFKFDTNKGFSFGKFAILDSGIYSGSVYVQIEPTDSLNPRLSFEISSYGKNKIISTKNQKSVSYNMSQSDNDLILSPFFKLPPNKKWSGQKVTVRLLLPIGYKIRFNEDAVNQLNISENVEIPNIEFIVGRTYQMSQTGLIIID